MTTVEELRTELELARLADLLATEQDALTALVDVAADDLAVLRHGLADGLTAHHAAVFQAFAQASALVPATLAATITRRMIGPSLAGRIAGSMDVDRAAALLAHFDTPFLADCCRTLSPDAAARLVPTVDDDVLVATTAELAARDDHATLGRFVDVLDDRRLHLVLDALADARDLLLAGAAVDDGAVLDRVLGLLTPGRRLALLRAATLEPAAGANVLVRISTASRALLLAATESLTDDEVVDLLDQLTATVRTSPALRIAVGSLPGRELAAASALLDRCEPTERAMGRLVMAVIEESAT